MLSGLLRDAAPRRRDVDLLHRSDAGDDALAEAERLGYRLALISCAPEGGAVLLEHNGEGWRQVVAWQYPADAQRQRWQRILAWEPLCRGS